ncbi:MAG: 16S rRNA (guanine(527)-N(7))-methyltransferase RsmG [Terracidiphilus sp.]
MSPGIDTARTRLNQLLGDAGLDELDDGLAQHFEVYLSLILRWNAHMNLTAIRDEDGVLSRHFVESIACARRLPVGIGTLLDFGSGAGFPGVPIALCRPEIAVTLAESQAKKAAFLHEAVRVLRIGAKVHSGRAESLRSEFDCLTMRAVDKMVIAVQKAGRLVRPGGWLVLMTSGADLERFKEAVGAEFRWEDPTRIAGAEQRLLALGKRNVSMPA